MLRDLVTKDPKLANFQEKLGGNTPLIRACVLGDIESATLLIKTSANVNIQAIKSQDSALHKAVMLGKLELLQLLVQSGANVNAKNKNLAPPLAAAFRNLKNPGLAMYLIDSGTQLDDFWFATSSPPLLVAIEFNCSEDLLDKLLSKGARIEAGDSKGVTALHFCCKWILLRQVKFLIHKGAK